MRNNIERWLIRWLSYMRLSRSCNGITWIPTPLTSKNVSSGKELNATTPRRTTLRKRSLGQIQSLRKTSMPNILVTTLTLGNPEDGALEVLCAEDHHDPRLSKSLQTTIPVKTCLTGSALAGVSLTG